jgi:hypothetical protein
MVIASSKTTPDRMMLDQLEALVQPTQFLEHLRKKMPMTEGQLEMVSAMHEAMFRRLNTLEMLHKGGRPTSSGRVHVFWPSWIGEKEGKHPAEGQEVQRLFRRKRWRRQWLRRRLHDKTQGTTCRRWACFQQSGATGHPDTWAGLPSSAAAAAAARG